MVATLLSAWLVAEQSKTKRKWGFWIFILSNVLWVAWGWKAHAYALIVLQFGLAALNVRGDIRISGAGARASESTSKSIKWPIP